MTDTRDPLPVVLKAAVEHVKRGDKEVAKANEHYVSGGLRFKELKERVLAGEAEEKTWGEYVAIQIAPTGYQRSTVDFFITQVSGDEPKPVAEDHTVWANDDEVVEDDVPLSEQGTTPGPTSTARTQEHRKKTETLKVANGGKPKGTRRDPEHAALARRFAEIGKKLTAGELQITIELIEAEFPRLLVS